MSYILEALQEAQKDRENGEVPNLHTIHIDPETSSPVGRKSLGYLSIVAVLVVGGLGIGWWVKDTRQLTPPISTTHQSVEQIAASQEHKPIGTEFSPASSDSSLSMKINSQTNSQQEFEQRVVSSEVATNVDRGATDEPSSQQAETVEKQQSAPIVDEPNMAGQSEQVAMVDLAHPALEEVMTVPGERQPDAFTGEGNTGEIAVEELAIEGMVVEDKIAEARVVANGVVADGVIEDPIPEDTRQKHISPRSIPHFRTLPVEVQQSLLTIVYSVHLYAPLPAHRMVKIDGLVRRAGDTIKPGLILEEITQTGAIFSFGDYTFRVPANG